MMRFKHLFESVVAAGLLIGSGALHAQAFPSKPVRIISPFSAGSSPDAVIRIIAEQLATEWKQAVIVDNRPGASGFIAAGAVKQAPPTGYDLLMADVGHLSINPSMFKSMSYDAKADFLPITTIFQTAFFVAVSAQSPLRSVKDLVAAAAASPGSVTYGSFALGSIGHLGGAQLEAATNTKMVHVPFKEAAQLYTSIATGDVTWGLGAPAGPAGAMLKAGKLRFLAVADSQRSPILPDVPTVKESGGPDSINGRTWVALVAPKGTPAAVVETIHRSVTGILRRPEIAQKFREVGLIESPSTPAELSALIDRDAVYWGALVKRTNANVN